jgi:hypothetical protein
LRSLLKNLFVEFLAYIVMRQDFYQTRWGQYIFL